MQGINQIAQIAAENKSAKCESPAHNDWYTVLLSMNSWFLEHNSSWQLLSSQCKCNIIVWSVVIRGINIVFGIHLKDVSSFTMTFEKSCGRKHAIWSWMLLVSMDFEIVKTHWWTHPHTLAKKLVSVTEWTLQTVFWCDAAVTESSIIKKWHFMHFKKVLSP